MATNLGGLSGPVAVAKGFTLILGLVSVILGWHAYYWSFFNCVIRYDLLWYIDSLIEEQIFIYATLIILITSIVCLIFNAVSESSQSQAMRMADFVFHLLCTIALLVIASLMIYSTIDIDCNKCLQLESYLAHERVLEWVAGVPCQLYEEKMAAGVIALLNGILYGITGILVITTSPYY